MRLSRKGEGEAVVATDPRNEIGGPRRLLFQGYVLATTLAGIGALFLVLVLRDVTDLRHLDAAAYVAAGLLIVSEGRPLFVPGARDVNGVVVSTAFVFAMLLRYDVEVALALQTVAVLMSHVGHDRRAWRTAFNVAQYALSWLAAWAVMAALGHQAAPQQPADLGSGVLAPAVAGAATFFVANELLVAVAIALRTGTTVWHVLRPDLGFELLTSGSLLAFGPVVALVMQAGPGFVPLLVPALVAVYFAVAAGARSERQARSDSLTGLANRKQLADRIPSGPAALVLLDLDMFKQVNDTLGHHVGDQLLVAVAQRLQACVRPADLVARLGGDEFALLLEGADVEGATAAAARAREALSEPFSLGGLLVEIAASTGIAVSPEHGTELEDLLQRADVAMYLSKESGEVEVYDASRDPNTTGRLVLLGALRRAIEQGELVLHYQPKADVVSGRVVGLEALVRWDHPQWGLVLPDAFIPLAERSGLITPLTSWLLDESLRQLAVWRDEGWDLCMAVNITVKDLCTDTFVPLVGECLQRHGLDARVLQLELTEGSLFADSLRAKAALKQLRDLGVSLSLDDFGTGWSSLTQLRQLPVSELKVDRGFVGRMAHDTRDHAIVTSVVDLARGLGMRVVAEGVEDDRTWRLLAGMGCDRVQGWALSPARPADEMTAWLTDRMAVSTAGDVTPS